MEKRPAKAGLPFDEAMRLLAGAARTWRRRRGCHGGDWSQLDAGPWLADDLQELARSRRGWRRSSPGAALKATLRPYQQAGVRWLYLLIRLGLGACLADDMGLGKTIQVLSLLLVLQRASAGGAPPSLLVAPASLLANWAAEIERFAPDLRAADRPSVGHAGRRTACAGRRAACRTSISSSPATARLLRQPVLADHPMARCRPRRGAGDQESGRQADASRSSSSRRSRASRSPARRSRTAWPTCGRSSISLTPACWARPRVFADFAKRLAKRRATVTARCATLVRPYILRRLKTDKRVIADLPDKTEVKAFCDLSREPGGALPAGGRGAGRSARGAPKASAPQGRGAGVLMRFKQICNHPSQWLGDGGVEAGRQRQVRPPARDCRSDRRAGRRRCWSSPSSAR